MTTNIKYRLTWDSETQCTRREAHFTSLNLAESLYEEKLEEGKRPQLWKIETITTFEELCPLEYN